MTNYIKNLCNEINIRKEKEILQKKVKENIGKPKELQKALKSLGLPSKKGSISNIFLKKDDKISFNDKASANIFKDFFLTCDLVSKLSPPPSNKFGISSVGYYYQNVLYLLPSKFEFSNITKDFTLH